MDLPPLPPGFKLDAPPETAAGLPPLPPGFKLDGSAAPALVNNLTKPVTDIPKDIGQDFAAGSAQVKQGEADLTNPQADLGGRVMGGIRSLVGGAQQAAALATGAGRALLSDPIRNTGLPGSKLAGDVVDTGIGMAAPGAEAGALKGLASGGMKAAEGAAKLVPSIEGPPRPGAQAARQAGYVLTPGTASEKPGLVSQGLGKIGGKSETLQAASMKNQEVTNKLSAKALGLPDDTTLNDKVFQDVRAKAGKAYEAVKQAVPIVRPDAAFRNASEELGGANSQAAKLFPRTSKNLEINRLIADMKGLGGPKGVESVDTDALMEKIKELRYQGNTNLKAIGDPSKHALGLAQRDAAHAIESLIERNVSKTADQSVIDTYKAARKQIAKSYDIEGATNPTTGDVSARGLGRLALKGRPFTDQLKTIADAANGFPKAFQSPQAFGGSPSSGLDFFLSSAAAGASGKPGLMALVAGKPIAQSIMLSEPYQNRMIPGATPSNP